MTDNRNSIGIFWDSLYLTLFYLVVTWYKYIEDIYLIIYFVAMSTTLINPLVYFIINSKFRHYLKR